MLYFNRIAKTGSQSFTRLLIRQGEKLGFEVKPKIHQTETLADSATGVSSEVASVLATDSPMVFIRHYNFINFEKHSSGGWRPDWFNIVRDPIDKVCYIVFWKLDFNCAVFIRLFLGSTIGELPGMLCLDKKLFPMSHCLTLTFYARTLTLAFLAVSSR